MCLVQYADHFPVLDTADELDLFLELALCVTAVEPGLKAELIQKTRIKPARRELGV